MNLWDEWEFKTKDIEHDKEGNEVLKMDLILTIAASRGDVVNAIADFLERGLK
jgi:hypothetical protein